MALLNLNKLTVRFGGLTAVDGVDCAVEEKQIYSIIGPNGAGKTTVFNAITGIYEPTSGSIVFRGRPLERPLSWRVIAFCVVIGLLTGLVAALASINVDALWRATIKRNFAGPGQPFSYRAAWDDIFNYMQGRLALESVRGNRWAVRSADGRRTLGYANTRDEAEQLLERQSGLIEVAADLASGDDRSTILQERDGKWVVRNRAGTADLATFDNKPDAQAVMEKYAEMAREGPQRQRTARFALLGGFVVGAAGAWTVWNRGRRTPEVIARFGIARTFQNIRLFQNMTVLDNVLCGMDRRLSGGIVRMALQLPSVKREELLARERAETLLQFVGLAGKHSMLAKNLPYGDQRRLEVARALATEPQLILLDEPAAGMNPTESSDLNRLILKIRDTGISVSLIEHHMKVVMGISDRIAVLEYGVKIAEGTPEQVRNDPRVIAAYLGGEEVT